MNLEEQKQISKKNPQNDIMYRKNDITYFNLMKNINKILREELSKTVSELLEQGFRQKYLAKILGIDQPKISLIKRNSPKIDFSDSIMMKYLRILGVYTIIDTGQEYISDTIKFYTDEEKFVCKFVVNLLKICCKFVVNLLKICCKLL